MSTLQTKQSEHVFSCSSIRRNGKKSTALIARRSYFLVQNLTEQDNGTDEQEEWKMNSFEIPETPVCMRTGRQDVKTSKRRDVTIVTSRSKAK